jgi:hypothetical protein
VRDVLERHVDAGYVPGAVAVVARHGEVHIEATGSLAFEGAGSGTPMAADAICRIGSMTKPAAASSRPPPITSPSPRRCWPAGPATASGCSRGRR